MVTNFEQLAIYDCSVMPYVTDESFIARKYLLTVDEYVENYDILNMFLSKDNVISGNIRFVNKKGNTIDEKFAKLLGEIRKKLATAILASNKVESVSTLSFYVQTIIDRILLLEYAKHVDWKKTVCWQNIHKGIFGHHSKKVHMPNFMNTTMVRCSRKYNLCKVLLLTMMYLLICRKVVLSFTVPI